MFQQSREIFNDDSQPCDDDIKTFVTKLLLQHAEFRNIFTHSDTPIDIEDRDELESKFKELFPDKSLTDIVKRYKDAEERDACSITSVYDPKHKKTYNPKILRPIKQTSSNIFNAVDFLKEQQSKGNYYNFNFALDYEICFHVEYDDRKKIDIMVDNSLKSMGELVLRLNQNRSDIPYNLVELHNEARIN